MSNSLPIPLLRTTSLPSYEKVVAENSCKNVESPPPTYNEINFQNGYNLENKFLQSHHTEGPSFQAGKGDLFSASCNCTMKNNYESCTFFAAYVQTTFFCNKNPYFQELFVIFLKEFFASRENFFTCCENLTLRKTALGCRVLNEIIC